MSFHGTNTFIPFPRYENAVFIGDTAAETLAELKIYARGLIGERATKHAVLSSGRKASGMHILRDERSASSDNRNAKRRN